MDFQNIVQLFRKLQEAVSKQFKNTKLYRNLDLRLAPMEN